MLLQFLLQIKLHVLHFSNAVMQCSAIYVMVCKIDMEVGTPKLPRSIYTVCYLNQWNII